MKEKTDGRRVVRARRFRDTRVPPARAGAPFPGTR
jgi:hypothetical protein